MARHTHIFPNERSYDSKPTPRPLDRKAYGSIDIGKGRSADAWRVGGAYAVLMGAFIAATADFSKKPPKSDLAPTETLVDTASPFALLSSFEKNLLVSGQNNAENFEKFARMPPGKSHNLNISKNL